MNTETTPRQFLSSPRAVLVATAIGTVSVNVGPKYAHVETSRTATDRLAYRGKHYAVRLTLQQVGGAWAVNRTEAGNESDASLDIFEYAVGSSSRRLGNTATRREIRDILLAAVNAHLSAHPELHAQAVRAESSNEILNTEDALAKARANVAQLEAKLAQLVAAEVR